MSEIKTLAHIGVQTPDIETSIAFYTDVLGFTLGQRIDHGNMQIAFISAGACTIELICPEDKASVLARGNGKIDHIALAVEDLAGAIERLQSHGVEFDSAEPIQLPNFGENGVQVIFFSAPTGERLELCQAY